MSRGADRLQIIVAGEVKDVELFEMTWMGIPIVLDPDLPPDEARVVSGDDAVRITGIGSDTPSG